MSLFTRLQTTENIPSQFPQLPHPKPPMDNNGDNPVETNKFYANMLLDNRDLFIYPLPYSVWWTGTEKDHAGLAVSHQDPETRVFGPDAKATPVEYFFSPTGVMSLCLGAGWRAPPKFSTNAWGPMSVTAMIQEGNAQVKYPICSGMGFVTAIYSGIAPVITSGVGLRNVETATSRNGVTRVNLTLEDNKLWSIYVTSPSGMAVTVTQRSPQVIHINSTESNLVVQVAKVGDRSWQPVIDSAAGAYPTQVSLDGAITSDRKVGTYAFNYNVGGSSLGGGTLIYAAPHHVESFTSTMNGKVTPFYLDSPTMGWFRLCVTTELEMFERLPDKIGFLPWNINKPEGDEHFSYQNYTRADIDLLVNTALSEINNVDIADATNLDSMYFSGKVMSKFANILLTMAYIARETQLAKQLLARMKEAMGIFIHNKQKTPLFYDKSWKGLVSQAGIKEPLADFGNTYYNDHHFHYGYFIHSAAIVGKVDQDLGDGSWSRDSTNRDWVNSLIRDIATFGQDQTYPQSRMFDWFSGHGLAKGLFVSADGKDQESSSEDYNCWYGTKLWASVIGDSSLAARSNLMLAIERRSMNHYMLYAKSNTTMPRQIIGNKVCGIKFENKIDHTTYFGNELQYIQGIHMLPTTPISSFIRSPDFIREEWEEQLRHIIDKVDDGWKGILMLDYGLSDPQTAYNFFASQSFQPKWLDNGQSRTWGLGFTKALI